MTRIQWYEYFLNIAEAVSKRSPDTRTQVGAVLVGPDNRIISTGYNGPPAGFPDDVIDYHSDSKYKYIVHAEMNAVLYAHRNISNSTLYTTLSPCAECLKMLAGAKVSKVVFRKEYSKNKDDYHQLALDFGVDLWQSFEPVSDKNSP